LYAGTIEPRKNIDRLLTAFELLPAHVRELFPFVVVGYRGWKSEALHERLQRAEAQGWARYLGFVPGGDLPVIYGGAKIFAFPSLYEGFGLPALEAMASGVPVVCSNASSLPEVVGDCALTCDPQDVEGLATLLERAVLDSAWRDAAILRGVVRASNFSWDKTVAGTLAAYRMALVD
jgi:alpha-1,3-rhamnosyl/mannosyltransferase